MLSNYLKRRVSCQLGENSGKFWTVGLYILRMDSALDFSPGIKAVITFQPCLLFRTTFCTSYPAILTFFYYPHSVYILYFMQDHKEEDKCWILSLCRSLAHGGGHIVVKTLLRGRAHAAAIKMIPRIQGVGFDPPEDVWDKWPMYQGSPVHCLGSPGALPIQGYVWAQCHIASRK